MPLIQGVSDQLTISDGTVATNMWQSIQCRASKPHIQQYLCQQNLWSPSKISCIDWPSHAARVCQRVTKHHFLIKYVCNWLPLGKQHSQCDPLHSPISFLQLSA